MTRSVLLVDDERNIREGLRTIIPWESHGFRIVGEASDGAEALARVEALRPDVVMTDIRMPVMDGLALVKELRARNPMIRCVILTGFSEFSYALEAIRLACADYLVKPVDEDDLIASLRKIRAELDADSLRTNRSSLRRLFIERDASAIGEVEEALAARPGERAYQLLLLRTRFRSAAVETVLEDFVARQNAGIHFIFEGVSGFIARGSRYAADRLGPLRGLVNDLRAAGKADGIDPVLVVGGANRSVAELFESFSWLSALFEKRFLYERDGVLWADTVGVADRSELASDFGEVERLSGELLRAVEFLNLEEGSRDFNAIVDRVKSADWTVEKTLSFFAMLFSRIVEIDGRFFTTDWREILFASRTLRDVESLFLDTFERFVSVARTQDADAPLKIVLNYMTAHFAEPLHLRDIAERIGYHPDSLGRKFRAFFGEGFNDRLNRIRIEHAKRLLLEGLRVADCAERSGFSDTDYFLRTFKRFTSCSPQEFRRTLK